jgi:hypothetical protein
MLYIHFTIYATSQAPSRGAIEFPTGAALTHFIVVAPDYYGFGVTEKEPQAYCISRANGRAALDAYLAAKRLIEDLEVKKGDDFIVAGYSEGGQTTMGVLREISELESIGDSCFNMARTISRKYQGKEDHFNEAQYTHLHQMMELTNNSLTLMNQLMTGRKESFDVNRTFNTENEINNYRNQLKQQNIIDVNNHEYTYAVGTIYMDIINECEKLGDYVVNVVEARMGMRMKG